MTSREILIWPDPNLTKRSEPIELVDDGIRALAADLIETMEYEGNCAGLAAPQIGVQKRLFVVDISPDQNDGNGTNGPQAFINPEIISTEGSFEWEEACMSIPGERGPVKRSDKIRMRYLDLDGNTHEIDAFGYLSGCFQHEIDHLNGRLWIDYQSRLKQELVRKKMLKLMSRQ
jgi:peptide deformylase